MLVKGFKQFNEEKLKSVTFTFGRFNPPTIGHEKLITEVIKLARGKDYKIFGESGVEKTAKEFNKKFLGHLPIHQDLRSSADKGIPLTHSDPDHEVSLLFKNIAENIKQSFQ